VPRGADHFPVGVSPGGGAPFDAGVHLVMHCWSFPQFSLHGTVL
jgi:hypothetical protein